MKTDAVYTPSDVYETFPFPADESLVARLESLGDGLHETRQRMLAESAIGLTELYKQFHSPSCSDAQVERLRSVHRDIDYEVARAYGWFDIALDHGFHEAEYVIDQDKLRYTVSEPARFELMRRLSALNRQRYQAEQSAAVDVHAALAEVAQPGGRRRISGRSAAKKAADTTAQTPLFD